MDIEYNEDFNMLIVRNVFDKKTNESILNEAIDAEPLFTDAEITNNSVINKGYRSNKVLYPDNIYPNNRHKSITLTSIDKLISDSDLSKIIASSPNPIGLISGTNYNETQISRYGDDGQHYKFHKDNFDKRNQPYLYHLH